MSETKTATQPYITHKAIGVVKAEVSIEEYAKELTSLKPSGIRLVGKCPVPEHQDSTASFNIYPESQTWWCFGACGRGGDIFDLFIAVEGGELWEAIYMLAERYAVKLPQRPDRWHEWSNQKAEIRSNLRRALAKRYRRRLFRMFAEEFDSEAEAKEFWDELWPTAWAWAGLRVAS